jgi:hypothetical protein
VRSWESQHALIRLARFGLPMLCRRGEDDHVHMQELWGRRKQGLLVHIPQRAFASSTKEVVVAVKLGGA